MTIPLITAPVTPFPQAGDSGDTFNERAFAAWAWLATAQAEMTAFANAANAMVTLLFRGTSTQSNTIASSGTKSFPTQTNLGFGTGQPVMVSRSSDPTKYMIGQVGSYDYTSGAFSLNVLKSNGSGTFSDWTITLLPDTNALPTSGGVMTGPLTMLSYLETVVAPVAGAAFSPDFTAGTEFYYQTNANTTITLPTPVVGKSALIGVKYGGAHTLGWAGGTLKWPLGVTPTPTAVNGKWDLFGVSCFDATAGWLGWTVGQNY